MFNQKRFKAIFLLVILITSTQSASAGIADYILSGLSRFSLLCKAKTGQDLRTVGVMAAVVVISLIKIKYPELFNGISGIAKDVGKNHERCG